MQTDYDVDVQMASSDPNSKKAAHKEVTTLWHFHVENDDVFNLEANENSLGRLFNELNEIQKHLDLLSE